MDSGSLGTMMWRRSTDVYRFASIRTVQHLQLWSASRDPMLSKYLGIPYYSCRCMTVQSDNQQHGSMSDALKKLGTMIKAFTLGTKNLYYDVKRMRQLQKTHGKLVITNKAPLSETGFTKCPFKLEEVQFIYQTKSDLIKMLPTVTLFMVPLVGYVAPVIAFMFPQHLLSRQFWTDDLKKGLEHKEFSTRMQHLTPLSLELGNTSLPLLKQQLDSNEGVQKYATTFPQLTSIERSKLATLSGVWGVSPLLPKFFLQKRLEQHLNYIFLCDWLLRHENPADIQEKEVSKFCIERCLQGNRREDVTNWISVSTHYRECPTSLLAHLPALFK